MTWRMICNAQTQGLVASFAPMAAGITLNTNAPSCFTGGNHPNVTALYFHGRVDSVR